MIVLGVILNGKVGCMPKAGVVGEFSMETKLQWENVTRYV